MALLAASLVPARAARSDDLLIELVERYYDEFLLLQPILATFNGDHRFDDRFKVAISPEAIDRGEDLERRFLKHVEAIDPDDLEDGGRLTRELFLRGRRTTLEGQPYPGEL